MPQSDELTKLNMEIDEAVAWAECFSISSVQAACILFFELNDKNGWFSRYGGGEI